jgi:hypothetical protein
MRRSVRKRCQHHNRKKVCTPSSTAFTARPLSSRSVIIRLKAHADTCSVEASSMFIRGVDISAFASSSAAAISKDCSLRNTQCKVSSQFRDFSY